MGLVRIRIIKSSHTMLVCTHFLEFVFCVCACTRTCECACVRECAVYACTGATDISRVMMIRASLSDPHTYKNLVRWFVRKKLR